MRLIAHVLCAALALGGTSAAYAQEPSESSLDVTIRLLPENAVGPEESHGGSSCRPQRRGRFRRRRQIPPKTMRLPVRRRGGRDESSSEARERAREAGGDA